MKIKDEMASCGGMTKEHGYLGHFTKPEHLSRGHNSYPANSDEAEERPGAPENRLKGDERVLNRISSIRNDEQVLGGRYGLYSESDRLEDERKGREKFDPQQKEYTQSLRRQRGK